MLGFSETWNTLHCGRGERNGDVPPMNALFTVYVLEPRIARVGRIELPAALVAAYPSLVVAVKLREGQRGAPDHVLLQRGHLRAGVGEEIVLVVAPGKDLEILTRLDEFTRTCSDTDLDRIQASVQ